MSVSLKNNKIPNYQRIDINKNNNKKNHNFLHHPPLTQEKKRTAQNFKNEQRSFNRRKNLQSFQIEPPFDDPNLFGLRTLSDYSSIPYSMRNIPININLPLKNKINPRTATNSNNNDDNYNNPNLDDKRHLTPSKNYSDPNIGNNGRNVCIDESNKQRKNLNNDMFFKYENFDNSKYIQDLEKSLELYKKTLANLLKKQSLSPINKDNNKYKGIIGNFDTNHLINLTIENLQLKNKLYQKDIEKMKEQIINLIKQNKNIQMENKNLKIKIKTLENKNKNLQKLNNLKNELKKKDEEINNLKENIKSLNIEFNSYKSNNQPSLELLKEENKRLNEKIIDLQTTILNNNEKIKELEKVIVYIKRSNNECNVIVNSFNLSQNPSLDKQLQLSSRQDQAMQEKYNQIIEKLNEENEKEKSLK